MSLLTSAAPSGIQAGRARHTCLGELPEMRIGLFFARVGGDAEEAGQHADDIAVENGGGLIESDAGNRAGSVAAYAREREQVAELFGEFAVVLREDLLRGPLQIANARVVAEAFPKFVDFVGMGFGQSFNGGQLAHPAFPIGDDGFDLRLLEHDFRHPDGVGIARAPPREVAGIGGEPRKQL